MYPLQSLIENKQNLLVASLKVQLVTHYLVIGLKNYKLSQLLQCLTLVTASYIILNPTGHLTIQYLLLCKTSSKMKPEQAVGSTHLLVALSIT